MARRFAVNIIQARQASVAQRLATKTVEKFADLAWTPAADGSAILHEQTGAWAELRVGQELEAGDHLILIGEVTSGEVAVTEGEALVYFRRRFGNWAALDPPPSEAPSVRRSSASSG